MTVKDKVTHQQNHTHYQKQQLLVVLGMAVHLDLSLELLILENKNL
jgi:hypothetical protein